MPIESTSPNPVSALDSCLDGIDPAAQPQPLNRWLETQVELAADPKPLLLPSFRDRSREIETIKQCRPRAALVEATTWVEEASNELRRDSTEETVRDFCEALSIWGGLQRHLGRIQAAALAQRKALHILQPSDFGSDGGFALQRTAFVLADHGRFGAGLRAVELAVNTQLSTPGAGPLAGMALVGMGVFHLYYRREPVTGRLAFEEALRLLPVDDELMRASALHGIATSFLMADRLDSARSVLIDLEHRSAGQPHLLLRCDWLKAEIAAAGHRLPDAITIYQQLFKNASELAEPSLLILISFDWAKVCLSIDSGNDDLSDLFRAVEPETKQLERPERLAIEPYLDSLASGEMTVDLLDQTAVAFKSATDRMTLGMGRSGAAGHPEHFGNLSAA